MDLGLEGRVALVTASSKGLGLASAQALSQEGAKVVLCARNGRALEEAAAAMPGEALAVPADVTDPGTPARLVAAAVERFGGLHVLVANAGGPPPGRAPAGRRRRNRRPAVRSAPSSRKIAICSSAIAQRLVCV